MLGAISDLLTCRSRALAGAPVRTPGPAETQKAREDAEKAELLSRIVQQALLLLAPGVLACSKHKKEAEEPAMRSVVWTTDAEARIASVRAAKKVMVLQRYGALLRQLTRMPGEWVVTVLQHKCALQQMYVLQHKRCRAFQLRAL
jgi:hypothetical protein